ncbi:MAG: DUF4055 domain-containing protein [Oscillospiraceae bacterium]
MTISQSLNEQYLTYLPMWTKCRDAYNGQYAVHNAGIKYLPKLSSNESDDGYLFRLNMATFFGAMQRTVDAMVGTLFKNPMIEQVPDYIKDWYKSVTSAKKVTGIDFKQFARDVTRELITVGRHGVLVDFPRIDTANMTQQQFDDSGLSVYLKQYYTEDILDWFEEDVGGVSKLVFVRLQEKYGVFNQETRNIENKERIRDLVLKDGVYHQIITTDDSEETITPKINGLELNYIPFVFLNCNDNKPDIDKPMLIDMVDINFDHYRTNADYKYGMHFAALPTPYITGISKEQLLENNSELCIGPRYFILVPEPEGKVGYLQPNAEVFKDYREELKVLEDRMAVLGARALITERKQSETAEAINLKSAGEQSVIGKLADTIANGLTSILRIVDDWLPNENTKEIKLSFNKDFGLEGISSSALSELLKGVQAGQIPSIVYFQNLKRAGYVQEDMDYEKYVEETNSDDLAELDEIINNAKNKINVDKS